MIDFGCEHCGCPISVPRSMAGQTGSCPECGETVSVPVIGFWRKASKHKRTIVAGVILTGLVCTGILYIRGGGGFPPYRDVEAVLKAHGYRLHSEDSAVDLLDGLRFRTTEFVIDPARPHWAKITVYRERQEPDKVMALVAIIDPLARNPDYETARLHHASALLVISDLSGITTSCPFHIEEDGRTDTFRNDGFTLERFLHTDMASGTPKMFRVGGAIFTLRDRDFPKPRH